MGEGHDAGHSVAQARQRVSAIAEELSRRANGDYVRTRARETLKERAKMKAKAKTFEARDRLIDNPLLLGLLTGAAGAIVGKALQARSRDRFGEGRYGDWDWREDEGWDRPYDEYTATHPPTGSSLITDEAALGTGVHQGVRGADLGGGQHLGDRDFEDDQRGLKEKASELRHKAASKMSEVGDRARHAASRVREKMPHSRDEYGYSYGPRERLRQSAASMRYTAEEHPAMWTVGAIMAGAFFGALMPVTQKERRVLGSAKTRAQSGLHTFKEEAKVRAEGLKENARAAVTGMASELGLMDEDRGQYGGQQSSTTGSSWQDTRPGQTWKAEGTEEQGYGRGYGTGTPGDPNERGSSWEDPDPSRH